MKLEINTSTKLQRSDLLLGLGRRLLLLLCFFVLGYALTVGLSVLMGKMLADKPAAFMRIVTVLQDLFAFILPAIATACVICRKPAELLRITGGLSGRSLLAILLIVGVSIPAMEALIHWNANLHFPAALAGIEEAARRMEEAASTQIELILKSNISIIGLILNILIIGVMAGFSEELLFRGCFQRLLTTGRVNPHIAIWTVAFVFSAFHFQVFGFVPRMLLGAYFGYLLLWTRSIWAPVLAHTLNNSIYVVAAWTQLLHNPEADISSDATGELYPPLLIVLSVIATASALAWLYLGSKKRFAESTKNS